ncbi:MAG: hypothetical protein KJ872_12690 [Alphaproteobacteria bacterium]|nr:hypothetical protein [Alphaproteobacteria bacterium]
MAESFDKTQEEVLQKWERAKNIYSEFRQITIIAGAISTICFVLLFIQVGQTRDNNLETSLEAHYLMGYSIFILVFLSFAYFIASLIAFFSKKGPKSRGLASFASIVIFAGSLIPFVMVRQDPGFIIQYAYDYDYYDKLLNLPLEIWTLGLVILSFLNSVLFRYTIFLKNRMTALHGRLP